MSKNTHIGAGTALGVYPPTGKKPLETEVFIKQGLIQFYISLNGNSTVLFNEGRYAQQIKAGVCLFLYNPEADLPATIKQDSAANLISVSITVEKLHELFVDGAEEIAFLDKDNIHKKYYLQKPLNPNLELVANQLASNAMQGLAKQLYQKAKVYEFLALFFEKDRNGDAEQCPFLKDESNVERIKKAKSIIIERLSNPPTLVDLAKEIGLNEYKLKEGFKSIYGKTVFQFLHDYRMDVARNLLEHKNLLVNEAAIEVGYSNPSHFIAAFKKKFGVTPKKYLGNLH